MNQFLDAIERATNISMAGRDVEVTPFSGAYGLAGYVMAVNGSPVCVVLMVLVRDAGTPAAFTLVRADGRARRIGAESPTAAAALDMLAALNLPLHAGAVMPCNGPWCGSWIVAYSSHYTQR
jgi:Flp pilus assembly protein TadB